MWVRDFREKALLVLCRCHHWCYLWPHVPRSRYCREVPHPRRGSVEKTYAGHSICVGGICGCHYFRRRGIVKDVVVGLVGRLAIAVLVVLVLQLWFFFLLFCIF
jgi:hypothetical protein